MQKQQPQRECICNFYCTFLERKSQSNLLEIETLHQEQKFFALEIDAELICEEYKRFGIVTNFLNFLPLY